MIMDRLFYNEYKRKTFADDHESLDYKNLDVKNLKKFLRYYEIMMEKYNIYESNVMSNILYDITCAIAISKFTSVQVRRLSLWLKGYSEHEIAEMEGVTRWVISKSIKAACNKILSILQE